MENEGVVGLNRWIEKRESIFEISFCEEDCMVKFVTCTMEDATMSWWTNYTKTTGVSVGNFMA